MKFILYGKLKIASEEIAQLTHNVEPTLNQRWLNVVAQRWWNVDLTLG